MAEVKRLPPGLHPSCMNETVQHVGSPVNVFKFQALKMLADDFGLLVEGHETLVVHPPFSFHLPAKLPSIWLQSVQTDPQKGGRKQHACALFCNGLFGRTEGCLPA